MMYSMTAFSRAAADAHARHLVWELKSVNHRFLETNFRMPDALRGHEHSLRELARKHLKRGKLDCTLKIERVHVDAGISLNRDILRQLMAAVEQVKRDAPDIGSLSPMELMRWPGVLDDTPTDEAELVQTASQLFEEALTDLIAARQREGEKLKTTVADRLDHIDATLTQLKTAHPRPRPPAKR